MSLKFSYGMLPYDAVTVFEEDTHEEMHLTAETGLPVFHMGPIPDMLLRERIEDLSPASLRRFDVRWAIALNGKPPTIGDPSTERAFGDYHVREIREWDGQFAIATADTPDVEVSYHSTFNPGSPSQEVWSPFANDGRLGNPPRARFGDVGLQRGVDLWQSHPNLP